MSEPNYALDAPPEGAELPPVELPYRPREPRGPRPRIGLIGCGGIAATHLQAYRDAGYDVAALCDRTLAKAEKLREEYFPAAATTIDYRDVLTMKEVQIVDLTPHPADRESLLLDAVAAGKHILSQKPFVIDLNIGNDLCDRADAAGVRIAVNQNGRWAPHLAYMREAVRAGLIGQPTAVRIAMQWNHNWIHGLPFDKVHHILLYDFAIHWLDFTCSVFQDARPRRVFASIARSPVQEATPPLLGQIAIDFGSAQATLSFDADTRVAPEDRTVIVGSRGTIRSEGPSLSDQKMVVHTSEGWFRPKLEGSWFPGGFHGAMAELMAAVEDGSLPQHNARDNLKALALCFEAVRSANMGVAVDCGSVRWLEADPEKRA